MPDELSENMSSTGPKFWKGARPRRPGEWQFRGWMHHDKPEEQPLGWSYRTAEGEHITPNFVELDHGLPPGAISDPEETWHLGAWNDRTYRRHQPFHPSGGIEWLPRPEKRRRHPLDSRPGWNPAPTWDG